MGKEERGKVSGEEAVSAAAVGNIGQLDGGC